MPKIATKLIRLALGAALAAAGCAEGSQGYYAPAPRPYSYSQPYNYNIDDVPPSFYGNDPSLRQWYTAPYWDPQRP